MLLREERGQSLGREGGGRREKRNLSAERSAKPAQPRISDLELGPVLSFPALCIKKVNVAELIRDLQVRDGDEAFLAEIASTPPPFLGDCEDEEASAATRQQRRREHAPCSITTTLSPSRKGRSSVSCRVRNGLQSQSTHRG